MKNFKKFTALLLTVLLVFSAMATGFTVSAADKTATFTVAKVEGKAGESVEVPVTVTTTGLAAAVFTVNFADGLTVEGYAIDEAFTELYTDEYDNAYTFALTSAADADFVGEDAAVVTFGVAVAADAEGQLAITVSDATAADMDELDVAVTTVDGYVDLDCDHANTTVVGKKDATCTEEGYTGDVVCDDCGEVVTPGEVIPATDHSITYTSNDDGTHSAVCSEGDYSVDAEPCDTDGTDGACSKCGYVAETECTHEGIVDDGVNLVRFTAEGIVHYDVCPDCSEEVISSVDTGADAVTVATKALAQKAYSAISVDAAGTYTIDVESATDLQYAYVKEDKLIANAAKNFHTSLYDGDKTNGENAFATSVSGTTVTIETEFAGIFLAFVPKNAARLSTNGTLGMNTYFSLESSIAFDLAINTKNIKTAFDDYYAIVNHQKYEGDTALPIEDYRIDEYTPNGTYYRFNYRISAMQMNDEISYRWYGVADGVDYLLRERVNYTLLDYAASQYTKTDANLKTLLSTLFKYGEVAQKYFNYRNSTETLVTSNEKIATYYATYQPATTIAQNDIEKLETTGSTHLDPNNKLFGYGRGLNCESTVEAYFGVKCLDFFSANPTADLSKLSFVISYIEPVNEASGTFTTVAYAYTDAYKVTESEKRYFFAANNIAATMMPSETKVDVYYDGVWQSGCNYSINNYLYSNYNKTSTIGGTANLGDICKAIATYGNEARTYFVG